MHASQVYGAWVVSQQAVFRGDRCVRIRHSSVGANDVWNKCTCLVVLKIISLDQIGMERYHSSLRALTLRMCGNLLWRVGGRPCLKYVLIPHFTCTFCIIIISWVLSFIRILHIVWSSPVDFYYFLLLFTEAVIFFCFFLLLQVSLWWLAFERRSSFHVVRLHRRPGKQWGDWMAQDHLCDGQVLGQGSCPASLLWAGAWVAPGAVWGAVRPATPVEGLWLCPQEEVRWCEVSHQQAEH